MTDDPNRKTVRQFQCRDYLWEMFEQMSQELQCSTDYLINEAMRHYGRAQGKMPATMPPGQRPNLPSMHPAGPPPPNRPPPPGPQGGVRGPAPMPSPNGGRPPPPPPYGGSAAPVRAPPPQGPQQGYPSRGVPAMAASGALFAVFEGQRYPITKDEFFIGRSNKSCDLIVKDPNVSRQHARVVRHQGQFWMVDMGSTNGIEHQGSRIDRRPIQEGDVYRICDHEIVFTYR